MHGNTPPPSPDLPFGPASLSDSEAMSRNLAQLAEESNRAIAALIGNTTDGGYTPLTQAETNQAIKTLASVAERWMADPKKAIEAQTSLMSSYLEIWRRTVHRLAGETMRPVTEPDPGDRRFRDPDWSDHPLFDFYKQIYLVTSRWAEDLVDRTDEIDAHTKHKAQFYVRQIAAAMAPSNFVMTNPELLRETLETNGDNLVRGMRMLAEDIERGNGELRLRQSDPEGFGVGVNLAVTPGKVVFQNDLMQLIQYAPATETVLKRPLLIVPPWINKFYILDLTPEKSFVRWAVDQGHTVFVVSWVNPDERLSEKTFADYVTEGPMAALDVIRGITRQKSVNAMGYCVGGTLLGVTLGYMAALGDDRIASATFLATQVDFEFAGDLKVFVDEEQLEALEDAMSEKGYLEGSRMATAFNMLRANDLIWPYVINNYLKGRKPIPFDLLYWNSDTTRMPAENHSFYLRQCYHLNNLSKGKMEISGTPIDLSKVTIPIYNLATREDHIAPAKSVFIGSQSFGGPVDYVLSGSGHIAGVVNPPSKTKYQYWTNGPAEGALEDWIAKAEETPGSWWPHWQAWIEDKDAARVKARTPGATKKYAAIEDAPGTYVKVHS